MKTSAIAVLLSVGVVATASASGNGNDLQREPCINGQVSASGLYETQALEDRAAHSAVELAQQSGRDKKGSQ